MQKKKLEININNESEVASIVSHSNSCANQISIYSISIEEVSANSDRDKYYKNSLYSYDPMQCHRCKCMII